MNNAKFTFYYLLSLMSLVFTAIGSGIILFQMINRLVPDARIFNGYADEAMRFGVAALFVAAPVYFLTVRVINKNVTSGLLPKDGPVRRWLTYLILFAASVTVLGWVIATINLFLNGELTLKFALKLLVVLSIAGLIFGFYLYDIYRRKLSTKDWGLRWFLIAGLSLSVGSFAVGCWFMDSPTTVRNKRLDNETISELDQLTMAIDEYVATQEKLPASWEDLSSKVRYVSSDVWQDRSQKSYFYELIDAKNYRLCAEFLTDNLERRADDNAYYGDRWRHGSGRFCFERSSGTLPLKAEPMLKD